MKFYLPGKENYKVLCTEFDLFCKTRKHNNTNHKTALTCYGRPESVKLNNTSTVSKITDSFFFLFLHILLSLFSKCFIMNTHHKVGKKSYFRSFKRKKSQWASTCDERLVMYGSKEVGGGDWDQWERV